MEFCPTCGAFLSPCKTKEGDKVIVVLACSKCGYKKKASAKKAQAQIGAGMVVQPKKKPVMTVISEEDQKMATLPTIKMQCPQCDNNLVYIWQVQTRGGDEASTQFMRCTKCGHTFREYT